MRPPYAGELLAVSLALFAFAAVTLVVIPAIYYIVLFITLSYYALK